MNTMDGVLSLEDLILATEATEPYVLSWRLDPSSEELAECTVLAVMRREAGVLLAIPTGFVPEAELGALAAGREDAVFGPHIVLRVASLISDSGVISNTGAYVDVLVVDCSLDVLGHLRPLAEDEEAVFSFDEESPFAFPSIDALLPLIREWATRSTDERAGFYTPEDADPEEVEAEASSPTPQRRKPAIRKGTPLGGGAKPKPKKPTTASLAQDMKVMLEAIPQISEQLGRLSQRQAVMEQRLPVGGRASPLPLSASYESHPAAQPPLNQLAKSIPPPPRTAPKSSHGLLGLPGVQSPAEFEVLEAEKLELGLTSSQTSGDALAKAVLAQSQALTTLVQQIAAAHTDPMADLTGSSSGGTRGASARAKLQAELAAHKGTFFQAVMQSMSRRMAPTSSSNASAEELLARGVSGVRYLERFGGYGRCRELGQLQFQVMSIFDFMMAGNHLAAMDGLALLAVTLEQASMDGGRMDLATLLCLQEDPPASVFVNRQLTATSRARAFAPLADQRWITCALAFLKELEVISAKRLEISGGAKGSETSSSAAPSTVAPKAKAKWGKKKGKGKGEAAQMEEGEA